jgi:Spy/CpxP family protein refolding chaperone
VKQVKHIFVISAIFLLMALPATKIDAQQHMGHGWRRDNDQHAKNLENLRMLKMLEVLDLSDEQSNQFISEFVSFRKQVNMISEDLEHEIDSLIDLLHQTEPSEKAIMDQISKIEAKKIKRENVYKEFHKQVANILTPVQLGKMVVFEEHFERELIESVRGFRNRVAPPMPDPNEVPGQ